MKVHEFSRRFHAVFTASEGMHNMCMAASACGHVSTRVFTTLFQMRGILIHMKVHEQSRPFHAAFTATEGMHNMCMVASACGHVSTRVFAAFPHAWLLMKVHKLSRPFHAAFTATEGMHNMCMALCFKCCIMFDSIKPSSHAVEQDSRCAW